MFLKNQLFFFSLEFYFRKCKTLTGTEYAIEATASLTVGEIQQKVAELQGCDPSCIRFMFGRKFLKNTGDSLANCGINKSALLKTIIILRSFTFVLKIQSMHKTHGKYIDINNI